MLSTLSFGCLAGLAAYARGEGVNNKLSRPTSFRVKVATQRNQNCRRYMEDFTQSADWSDDEQHPLYRSGFRLLAVFDGHGHHHVAQWLSANVKQFVGDAAVIIANESASKNEKPHSVLTPEQVKRVLSDAFFAMDEKLRQVSMEAAWKHGGATAVVVMISDTHVVSANVGDSRALLWGIDTSKTHACPESIRQSLVTLSKDHKPDDREERRRVERADGFSIDTKKESGLEVARIWPKGYNRPNLNLSRAFGDFHCKPYADKPRENPISVEPFIQVVPLNRVGRSWWESAAQRSFLLVLASDGVVNDKFGNEDLVSATQDLIQQTWNIHAAKKRCGTSECVGPDFLQSIPDNDWARVASSLLRRTKDANGGDNQSIHLAVLTQSVDKQLLGPGLVSLVHD